MEMETEIKYKLASWMKSNYSEEQVLTMLNEFPLSEFQKAEFFNSYKQGIHQIRTRLGFIYLGIGGFLGFISCVFSMIIGDHFWNSFFLYGGTSVAIVLAFIGFYFIFE